MAQRVGRDERHGWIGAVGTTVLRRNQPRLLGVAFDKDSKTCRSQKSTCSQVSMTTTRLGKMPEATRMR